MKINIFHIGKPHIIMMVEFGKPLDFSDRTDSHLRREDNWTGVGASDLKISKFAYQ